MRKYQYDSSFHNDDGPKGGSQGLPYVAPKKGDYRYGKFMATNRKKKDDNEKPIDLERQLRFPYKGLYQAQHLLCV